MNEEKTTAQLEKEQLQREEKKDKRITQLEEDIVQLEQELDKVKKQMKNSEGSGKNTESEVTQQQIHDKGYYEGFKDGRINLAQALNPQITEDKDTETLRKEMLDGVENDLYMKGLEIREAEPTAKTGTEEGGQEETEPGTQTGTEESDEEAPFKIIISTEPLSHADESFYSEEQGGYVNFIDKRKEK